MFSKSGCKSTTNFGQTQNLLGFLQILPWKTSYLHLLLTIKSQIRVLNTQIKLMLFQGGENGIIPFLNGLQTFVVADHKVTGF
ncbi:MULTISPECIES: hypothetical protein [Proteiniphilum]|uniref:hypothetical protein n=2 Tax=Dysgonomonadaceae TaxID=2005520 RepID=UPI001EEBC68A|nr:MULTISPECIES: hypothetical protein [Proteiniphilum]ULB35848.1 hypothetical protein KDN43_07505 [Proteiniphilum propionicum]